MGTACAAATLAATQNTAAAVVVVASLTKAQCSGNQDSQWQILLLGVHLQHRPLEAFK